jgi:hypothetical protein
VSAVLKPYGLRPVRSRHGGEIRSQSRRGGIATTYNTAIYLGAPMKLVTTGHFELAAAGDAISAVFAGVLFDDGGVWQVSNYWRANTAYTKAPQVLYYDVRQYEFAIQAGGSVAQSAIGAATDWVAGTANTKSGVSGGYAAHTVENAGASAQFKVIDLLPIPGNAWGDTYTQLIVMVNEFNLGHEPGNGI